jgi:hypothetical protein
MNAAMAVTKKQEKEAKKHKGGLGDLKNELVERKAKVSKTKKKMEKGTYDL